MHQWTRLYIRLVNRIRNDTHRDERGDIPGWVMITVLTIGMASVIFALFQARVTSFLQNTLDTFM